MTLATGLLSWQTRATRGLNMQLISHVGRPFALLMLFIVGIGLIWYVGHYLFPEEKDGVAFPASSSAMTITSKAVMPETSPSSPAPQASIPKTITDEGRQPHIVATKRGQFITAESILFNSGASTLREASIPILDKVAALLKEQPDIQLEIIGHTDNLGIEPVNREVSLTRANVVRDYLVLQGIDRFRLIPRGMGSLEPIAFNDTQLGRQANRRVELLAVKPGATP